MCFAWAKQKKAFTPSLCGEGGKGLFLGGSRPATIKVLWWFFRLNPF